MLRERTHGTALGRLQLTPARLAEWASVRQQTRGWDCAVGGPGRGGRRGGGGANIRTLFNGKIRSRSIVSTCFHIPEETEEKHTTHHTHTCGLFASHEGGIVAERPEEEQDFLQGDSTH